MNPEPESPTESPAAASVSAAARADLGAWLEEAMPAMVAAEDAPDWAGGWSSSPRPVTDLLHEDGPLATFLRGPQMPEEGAGRSERRSFYEDRDAAAAAALQAVQDAQEDHAHLASLGEQRRAAAAFDARLAAADKARQEKEQGSQLLRGPEPPSAVGRW